MQPLTLLVLGGLIGSALVLALWRGRAHPGASSVERQPLTSHTTLLVLRGSGREIMIVESARSITRIEDGSEAPRKTSDCVEPCHSAQPPLVTEATT
jgi:hypothetical protein